MTFEEWWQANGRDSYEPGTADYYTALSLARGAWGAALVVTQQPEVLSRSDIIEECAKVCIAMYAKEPASRRTDILLEVASRIRELDAEAAQPEEAPIMDRLYRRLAPLAFMPTEVSQEEAKRLGYPYVKLNDVETVIREELGK